MMSTLEVVSYSSSCLRLKISVFLPMKNENVYVTVQNGCLFTERCMSIAGHR